MDEKKEMNSRDFIGGLGASCVTNEIIRDTPFTKERVYCNVDVFNLAVFNNNKELIAAVNEATKSSIFTVEKGNGESKTYLKINNNGLKDRILELFCDKKEKDIETDYNKFLNNTGYSLIGNRSKEKNTYIFNNKRKNKEYKLIAKGILYDPDTENIENEYIFEIPKAKLVNLFGFKCDMNKLTQQDLVFELLPYNKDEDIFKMHIVDR